MAVRSFRDLMRPEKAFIADVLRRLREHFPEWNKDDDAEGAEHGLVGFAFYEGCGNTRCCGEILAEAAPFALGQELVTRHAFRWIMLTSGEAPRYGVMHPALVEPIDLGALEDGSWNDRQYNGPPSLGETTHDSLETIVERVHRGNSRGA
jgi:hypothetical protein